MRRMTSDVVDYRYVDGLGYDISSVRVDYRNWTFMRQGANQCPMSKCSVDVCGGQLAIDTISKACSILKMSDISSKGNN